MQGYRLLTPNARGKQMCNGFVFFSDCKGRERSVFWRLRGILALDGLQAIIFVNLDAGFKPSKWSVCYFLKKVLKVQPRPRHKLLN
jgi:hypothetical protein